MATARNESGRARVLLVEDDESTASFVCTVLERNGIGTEWVADAEQAESLLSAEDFDALLADHRLPGRSGVELAQRARSMRPSLGIGVMTSLPEHGLELAARAGGADDFFEKPLSPSNFVARVRQLVMGSRTVAERRASNPPAGGCLRATPADAAPGALDGGGAPGLLPEAGSGPGELPPQLRGDAVSGDTDWCGGWGSRHRHEGHSGASWARLPAAVPEAALRSRAAHPAGRAQGFDGTLACGAVLMWSSAGAAASPVGSSSGQVARSFTRPAIG